jgi:hypothetical protein
MNPYKLTRGMRVLVNLGNGDALVGKITDITRHAYFIGGAELFSTGTNGAPTRTPLDGEAIVRHDDASIAWIQVY